MSLSLLPVAEVWCSKFKVSGKWRSRTNFLKAKGLGTTMRQLKHISDSAVMLLLDPNSSYLTVNMRRTPSPLTLVTRPFPPYTKHIPGDKSGVTQQPKLPRVIS